MVVILIIGKLFCGWDEMASYISSPIQCSCVNWLIVPIKLVHNVITYMLLQVYEMLKQWKERDGEEAQSVVLEQALSECGMADAAIVLTSY